MILRDLLVGALATACVGTALWTCCVQAGNHENARALARLQRRWEMLEAANAQAAARAHAHVPGISNRDLDVTRAEVSKRLREQAASSAGARVRP